jgi:hypothetical protein
MFITYYVTISFNALKSTDANNLKITLAREAHELYAPQQQCATDTTKTIPKGSTVSKNVHRTV